MKILIIDNGTSYLNKLKDLMGNVVEPDIIFKNISDFKVFESHRWIIKKPISNLKVLAKSEDGIEAVRHRSRLVYGVQFHPEMFVDATCGNEIFNNFINTIKKNNFA